MGEDEVVRPDGQELKKLRDGTKGVRIRPPSQFQLGQKAGMSQSTVSKMEKGLPVELRTFERYLSVNFGITDRTEVYELTVDGNVTRVEQESNASDDLTEEVAVIFMEAANLRSDESFLKLWEELNRIAMSRLKKFGQGSIRATAIVSPESKAVLMKYAPVLDGEFLITRSTLEYIRTLKLVHERVREAQSRTGTLTSPETNFGDDCEIHAEQERRLVNLEIELQETYPSIALGEVTLNSVALDRTGLHQDPRESSTERDSMDKQTKILPVGRPRDEGAIGQQEAERFEEIKPRVTARDTTSGHSSFRRIFPTIAIAASLLAAVSISWSLWLYSQNASLRNTNAWLTARIAGQAELSQKTTSLTKESLGRTVADSTPLYLSGDTTANLVRQALLAATISSRSAALSDDEKADLERSRMLFEEAISLQQLEDPSKRNMVEEVTASIWSGDLDRAEELLQSTELTPDDPAVINLKGVLAMYESEYREDARPDLQKEAESFFGEAAGKGELIAWINLAVVLKRQGRNDEAVKALKMYIENATADQAQVVREFLPDTPSLPN